MKEPRSTDRSASASIDERLAGLADWRGDALGRMRALIHEADRRGGGSAHVVNGAAHPARA